MMPFGERECVWGQENTGVWGSWGGISGRWPLGNARLDGFKAKASDRKEALSRKGGGECEYEER